jgi:hypothetical protein
VRLGGVFKRGVSYKSPLSTFVENPQWRLVVPDGGGRERGAEVLVLVESEREGTAVNVTIAWSAGKRLARYEIPFLGTLCSFVLLCFVFDNCLISILLSLELSSLTYVPPSHYYIVCILSLLPCPLHLSFAF